MLTKHMGITNFKIKNQLALMLILPIACLIYFAAHQFFDKQAEITELEQLKDLVTISIQFGDLVHEIQKERGRTALFIASEGNSFKKELQQARKRTDQDELQLRNALSHFLRRQRNTYMANTIETALTHLEQIGANRQAVDQHNISSDAALQFYTNLNTNLLNLVDRASKQTRFKEIGTQLTAYFMLLQGKDVVGLERAETGQVFERQELTHTKLVRLAKLSANQEMFLNRFTFLSDNRLLAFYTQSMSSECVSQVNAIQKQIFDGEAIATIQMRAAQWFDVITCKINYLKQVEEHVAKNLQQQLNRQLTHKRQDYKLFIIMSSSALLLTFLFVLAIVAHIANQTRQLVQTMDLFSKGNQAARIDVVSNDEIGQLSHSFNSMAAIIEENNRQEQERIEQERLESEQFKERVHQLCEHLTQVAQGDLSQQTMEKGGDELAELGRNINTMVGSLANMSQQTESTIQALSTSLEEVQQAAHSQSAGATQQAAAINQTTTTLEEIRAVSGQTLEKAQVLGRTAERAREEGDQGHQAVKNALDAMRGILKKVDTIATTILSLSEQTGRIGEITSAVNNLAQQSKMLALNASIEAAKAGEAGKGFAVVADEVKNLAEQSQQFTTQVHRILEEIRHATDKAVMATEDGAKEVDIGANLTEQAGSTMQKLLEVLRQNSIAGQQIVAAVRQEVAGIEQIGTAMSEINKVTAQFVASTRQTVQATDDLGELSANLQESIRFFKL